jgi:hypothetical protein
MTAFPLPGQGTAVVAAAAPGAGPGWWAGAPCAVLDADGSYVIGYRVRNGHDGNDQTVIARSADGEELEIVAVLDESRFDAMGMERPALVRTPDGRWRIYICCATPDSKHWWIGLLEADDPANYTDAELLPGFPGDERTGVKDPVVRFDGERWHAWICCHPLDDPGHEDRMSTAYATSPDGLSWDWHGTILGARPGRWDARGARLTALLADGRVAYDGRATAEENWFEKTGLGRFDGRRIVPDDAEWVADARYLEVLALPDGRHRIYYEARLPDESHELRTELI